MRHLKLAAALAVAVCAFAATAASALASEFVTEPEAPTRAVSGTAGKQEFDLGPFEINCSKLKGKGEASRQDLTIDPMFGGCEATYHIGTQVVHSKALVKQYGNLYFNPEGFVRLPDFEVKVKSSNCLIYVNNGEGTGGSGAGKARFGRASYSQETSSTRDLKRFPSGFQEKLTIAVDAPGMPVTYGGSCNEVERTTGTYSGTLTDEVVKGNLGYVHTESEGEDGEEGTETKYDETENKAS